MKTDTQPPWTMCVFSCATGTGKQVLLPTGKMKVRIVIKAVAVSPNVQFRVEIKGVTPAATLAGSSCSSTMNFIGLG